jgi:hypothetical protein
LIDATVAELRRQDPRALARSIVKTGPLGGRPPSDNVFALSALAKVGVPERFHRSQVKGALALDKALARYECLAAPRNPQEALLMAAGIVPFRSRK